MKLHLLIELADGSFAFSVFFILGGAAWGPWAQAPPGMKKTEKANEPSASSINR